MLCLATLTMGVASPARAETVEDAQLVVDSTRKSVQQATKDLRAARDEFARADIAAQTAGELVKEASHAEVKANEVAITARIAIRILARVSYMDGAFGGELKTLADVSAGGPEALAGFARRDVAMARMQFDSIDEAQAAVVAAETARVTTATRIDEFLAARDAREAAYQRIPVAQQALSEALAIQEEAQADLATATTAQICAENGMLAGTTGNATHLWQQLLKKGYSRKSAAGILAILDTRGTLTPTYVNTDNTHLGIGYWDRDKEWRSFQRFAQGKKLSPWDMKLQTKQFLADLSVDPALSAKKYRTTRDPAKAARVAYPRLNTHAPKLAKPDAAALSTKARTWFLTLKKVKPNATIPGYLKSERLYCEPVQPTPTTTTPSPIVMPAIGPVSEASCPMVDDAYKNDFMSRTGLSWDGLHPNAQILTRCVHAAFPQIYPGTYNGHMPNWTQAIDFFVPNGCVNESTGARTTTQYGFDSGTALTQFVLANDQNLGVDYLIWQDHIRNPGSYAHESEWVPIDQWRVDNNNNGDCVNTHFDHVHISVNSVPAALPAAG